MIYYNFLKETPDFPVVKFDYDDVEQAEARRFFKDQQLGLNKFESQQRWMGYLGELAFREYLIQAGIEYEHHNTDSNKDLYDFTVSGVKIDVKTTVRRRHPTLEDHAVVPLEQINNSYDALVFVSYDPTKGWAYLLGKISKDRFKKESILLARGERDPEEGFMAIHSCYRIKAKHLACFE